MEFLQITDAEDFRAKEIFSSLSLAFPEEERRNEVQFYQLFSNPNSKIFSVLDDQQNIGYIVIWELSGFTFLEHFEVFGEFRNQNFGSKILSSLTEKYGKIVLESEPADLDETAYRRISFYERNGFKIIDKSYIQPSYGDGKTSLNIWLLANFTLENPKGTITEIHSKVYDFT